MVKDYQGLNDAKKEVTRSYEYSGTEKLQKCQELGEVRTCTSTAAQRSYRSARSWARYVRVRVRVQRHREATEVPRAGRGTYVYEYSGTEKLQKCQELVEVRTCTCTSTVA